MQLRTKLLNWVTEPKKCVWHTTGRSLSKGWKTKGYGKWIDKESLLHQLQKTTSQRENLQKLERHVTLSLMISEPSKMSDAQGTLCRETTNSRQKASQGNSMLPNIT